MRGTGIAALAAEQRIPTRYFLRAQVREAFAPLGAKTKHQIATATAERFPELALRLPPIRKCWMAEHYAMSIFDAVAWGLTFFPSEGERDFHLPAGRKNY